MIKRRPVLSLVIAFLALAGAAEAACRTESADDARYVVCAFDPKTDDVRLFLNDASGAPFSEFDALERTLKEKGQTLAFAMNAGMYRKDRSPVGLYIEREKQLRKLSTKDGPGNFHLKPNGVFWIDSGGAHVAATDEFASAQPLPQAGEAGNPLYATQSGPMLVIDGELHPKFLKESDSRKRRNGVGVRADGTVVFVITDSAVNFFDFARYFRDVLDCRNALYLDGTISRLYAPDLERNDAGAAMGPIVGVVRSAD